MWVLAKISIALANDRSAVFAFGVGSILGLQAKTIIAQGKVHEGVSRTGDGHGTMEEETFEKFLIWVDGVGGYLVCTGSKNALGQAIPETGVAIPVRGNIDREHAAIERVDGCHVLTPIGNVLVDQRPISNPIVLSSGQVFQMGDMVAMKYRQPHPLSSSAVLEFESRHRTFPWSDAVVLAGDTIVMGPAPRNHIVCQKWAQEFILFRRNNQWYCKSKFDFAVDSVQQSAAMPLRGNSRVEGGEFSFSIEVLSSNG